MIWHRRKKLFQMWFNTQFCQRYYSSTPTAPAVTPTTSAKDWPDFYTAANGPFASLANGILVPPPLAPTSSGGLLLLLLIFRYVLIFSTSLAGARPSSADSTGKKESKDVAPASPDPAQCWRVGEAVLVATKIDLDTAVKDMKKHKKSPADLKGVARFSLPLSSRSRSCTDSDTPLRCVPAAWSHTEGEQCCGRQVGARGARSPHNQLTWPQNLQCRFADDTNRLCRGNHDLNNAITRVCVCGCAVVTIAMRGCLPMYITPSPH